MFLPVVTMEDESMIDKCPKCNVKVDKNLTNCPLCGAYIEREEEDIDSPIPKINYAYPVVDKSVVWREIALRVVFYICVISIGICFLVNFLATERIFWAYHIVFGWVVFWFTLGRSLFFHLDIRKQICWYSIFAGIICYYIQCMIYQTVHITEAQNWALVWAIPAFLLGGIAFLFVLMLIGYKDWVRFSMPLTSMCLVTAVPAIASAALYRHVHFMIYICVGVGVISLLLMMIIGKDKYFLELKKKFFM